MDTTGCGDVFHGAYAAGLAEGLGLSARVRLASATAAMKATRPGDLRVSFQLSSDDMRSPVTKEESTRVYADE